MNGAGAEPGEPGQSRGQTRPRVALFATCLVDLMRPAVGFAAAKLIEDSGCEVVVPPAQTCCGQPAYNAGARRAAADLARRFIGTFEGHDYVVAPSGSCAAMVKLHFPKLLAEDAAWHERAQALAARTHELVSFLVDVRKVASVAAELSGRVTYHDACSGLRELGIKTQPRALLAALPGLSLVEANTAEECCGFGGTFCVKHANIATRIADDKLAAVRACGADTLAAGDLGCLLHLAGRLSRRGATLPIAVRHVAEILAGASGPAIGAGASEGVGE